MSIMAVVYSAPIASASILIFGFLVDLKIKFTPPNDNQALLKDID
jgi:hypothetical protein